MPRRSSTATAGRSSPRSTTAPGCAPQQLVTYDNLRLLGVAEILYGLEEKTLPVTPIPGDDPEVKSDITEHVRLRGVDSEPVSNAVGFTFVERDGQWLLGAERIDETERTLSSIGSARPWAEGPVAVRRAGAVTVVVDRSRSVELAGLTARVTRALGYVRGHARRGRPRSSAGRRHQQRQRHPPQLRGPGGRRRGLRARHHDHADQPRAARGSGVAGEVQPRRARRLPRRRPGAAPRAHPLRAPREAAAAVAGRGRRRAPGLAPRRHGRAGRPGPHLRPARRRRSPRPARLRRAVPPQPGRRLHPGPGPGRGAADPRGHAATARAPRRARRRGRGQDASRPCRGRRAADRLRPERVRSSPPPATRGC